MPLDNNILHRYERHIVIPEIGVKGQEKLLESAVIVYGDTVESISSLLYYLTAAGVGHIECCMHDPAGCQALFDGIRDLNNDVAVTLISYEAYMDCQSQDTCNTFSVISIDFKYLNNLCSILSSIESHSFMPVVVAVHKGWESTIITLKSQKDVKLFLDTLYQCSCGRYPQNETAPYLMGSIFSSCLLGPLSTIEVVKLILGLGTPVNEGLYIDLLLMNLVKGSSKSLWAKQKSEYKETLQSDKAGMPDYSDRLKGIEDKKVLIVGTGGLGSPAAYAMSLSGIGTIGLADCDTVDISNLNRQILHSTSRIGMEKVESACVFIKKLNPEIKIQIHSTGFNKDNAQALVEQYDLVIGALDNLPDRYLLNETCIICKKPLIESGVLKFDGLCMAVIPGKNPCYRCVFPQIPDKNSVPSCKEYGILGAVPGVLGFIESIEAFKILSGIGSPLGSRLLFFDAVDLEFSKLDINKNPSCPVCGNGSRNYNT